MRTIDLLRQTYFTNKGNLGTCPVSALYIQVAHRCGRTAEDAPQNLWEFPPERISRR